MSDRYGRTDGRENLPHRDFFVAWTKYLAHLAKGCDEACPCDTKRGPLSRQAAADVYVALRRGEDAYQGSTPAKPTRYSTNKDGLSALRKHALQHFDLGTRDVKILDTPEGRAFAEAMKKEGLNRKALRLIGQGLDVQALLDAMKKARE